ncbi:tetratricopeptide repeat protein [Acetobacter fallax]|uniref:Tetratricopeptide repeat protein n=1 Tax=Acetobacter fallax TaxID=1737473 RepID=A0ABX0K5Z8_9PROT|nr:tetratricopeptide repeat-containing glycosyltransferase family protein [Acetobacter fallax]NHO31310.1 tetratricopeptide repeat protein [Acetobacter fallax]NHO34867.1 tetratricopeptide repeat protein [Acetobacter fallax]
MPADEKGEALQRAGRLDEAAVAYREALARNPDDARILSNYGGLLWGLGAFEQAHGMLMRAVTLAPDLPDAWSNLGNVLQQFQRYDEAIAAYSNCLRLNPVHPLALSNLGVALDCRGEHAAAQKFHRIAVRLAPDNAENHTNFAISLLSGGDYRSGFAEYEWRWKTRTTRHHGLTAPLWTGASFEGKTLLIHTEGGFGDMLQFARFIPLAAERGGNIIVSVRPELSDLLRQSFPGYQFVTTEEPVPWHDLQCPVLSLPLALGVALDTIPASGGFLAANPQKVAFWAQQLAENDIKFGRVADPLRIGLVWAGAPHAEIREAEITDRRRSTSLETLAPLATAAPDALFYSLQVGDKAKQAQHPPAGMRLIDDTASLHNFDDTAALISNLDLVIAVDTSTAHVAAGLGKPVWLLSRYDQCWRWLAHRTDSPWYDSIRIYRQDKPLDWSGPVQRIVEDLKVLDASDKARSDRKELNTADQD